MLARNRARNNVSNTLEFLRPTKRRRVGGEPASMEVDGAEVEEDTMIPAPTSARTDAIKVDRDVQMKYDVATAAHGHGLLKQTVQAAARDHPTMMDDGQGTGGIRAAKGPKRRITLDPNMPTLERHPGLEGRFRDIEDHLFVRYGMLLIRFLHVLWFLTHPYLPCFLVPGPPEDIRLRLKAIEEHIIRLERDYPPWAALHFNQPNRRVCLSLCTYTFGMHLTSVAPRAGFASNTTHAYSNPGTPDDAIRPAVWVLRTTTFRCLRWCSIIVVIIGKRRRHCHRCVVIKGHKGKGKSKRKAAVQSTSCRDAKVGDHEGEE